MATTQHDRSSERIRHAIRKKAAVATLGAAMAVGVLLPFAGTAQAASNTDDRYDTRVVEKQRGWRADPDCLAWASDYFMDYIRDNWPRWAQRAPERAVQAFVANPNPVTFAVMAGLIGPIAYATWDVCRY